MTTEPVPTDNPRAYLDTIVDAARRADPLIELPHGRRRLLLPEGYQAVDVSDPFALPPWPAAEVTVDDRASLVAYVNRFHSDDAILLADIDAGTICGHIDWHSSGNEARPRRHKATLALRLSEEFRRWDAFEGEMHGQAEFAAFLEENASDVIDPEPGVLIEISRDLEATQGVTFKSSNRLESGDRAFRYELETRTAGEIKVPRTFMLQIPIYAGEQPIELKCALRFKVAAGGLLLGFEWRRVEYQRLAHFREIAFAAAEDTGRPVYFGRAASRG